MTFSCLMKINFLPFFPQFKWAYLHSQFTVLNNLVQTNSNPCLLKSAVTLSLLCLRLFYSSCVKEFSLRCPFDGGVWETSRPCVRCWADHVEILEAGARPRLKRAQWWGMERKQAPLKRSCVCWQRETACPQVVMVRALLAVEMQAAAAAAAAAVAAVAAAACRPQSPTNALISGPNGHNNLMT